MITRIKAIIKRGKKKQPGRAGVLLLLDRVFYVICLHLRHCRMLLLKDSTFTNDGDMFMCSLLPKSILDILISELCPSSVLDLGCGTGKSLEYFLLKNINAIGVENSKKAIQCSSVKDKILKYDLRKELKLSRKFDLVWCFEVIEHIHPKFESNFLRSLTNHSDFIVLSAARPGQGGHGHFNEQIPEYWIRKIGDKGFEFDERLTDQLRQTGDTHADNLLCFKKI